MNSSIDADIERQIQHDFLTKPVGMRVVLPSGCEAQITKVQGSGAAKFCKVVGIDESTGRYKVLAGRCWFQPSELRVKVFTFGISQDWLEKQVQQVRGPR